LLLQDIRKFAVDVVPDPPKAVGSDLHPHAALGVEFAPVEVRSGRDFAREVEHESGFAVGVQLLDDGAQEVSHGFHPLDAVSDVLFHVSNRPCSS
jgi:hypothetical protein